MEIIGKDRLYSFSRSGNIRSRNCFIIRREDGLIVKDFLQLATKVAQIQFNNPNYVMLFRGQQRDYKRADSKSRQFTSLAPRLFRGNGAQPPEQAVLDKRFAQLQNAEQYLIEAYESKKYPDSNRLRRQRILRWAMLQHYEICDTPLLDVTHSLRIAASFASHGNSEEVFVFVLGVPNLGSSLFHVGNLSSSFPAIR